jgi:endonuclease YncB( thermonuclease family)
LKNGEVKMFGNVINVVDGDTFEVDPHWSFRGQSGSHVRPAGYDAPEEGEPGYEEATEKLRDLIDGQIVELTNLTDIDRGRLVCDVLLDGVNIAEHFPEYR